MVLRISCILISHIPSVIKKIHSEISKMCCNSMHPAKLWTQNLRCRIGFTGREGLKPELGWLLFFPEGKAQWLFSSISLTDSNSTIDV